MTYNIITTLSLENLKAMTEIGMTNKKSSPLNIYTVAHLKVGVFVNYKTIWIWLHCYDLPASERLACSWNDVAAIALVICLTSATSSGPKLLPLWQFPFCDGWAADAPGMLIKGE